MKDKEIIKALEEHYRQIDAGYSTHLEYGGKGDEHEEKYLYMLRNVLDLISRQKDEIEGLITAQETLQRYVAKLNKELARADARVVCIGRSNGKTEMQRQFMQSAINEIKAEAIKEFAKRLKAKSYPFACAIGVENAVTIREINDLVKEMVGDTE